MHQYLDGDGSGTSETCVSSTIGQERITAATEWLKKTGKRGVIGEMAGGANANCITAVTGMLNYMEANSDAWMGWLWWGGGPWVSSPQYPQKLGGICQSTVILDILCRSWLANNISHLSVGLVHL